MPSKLWKLYSEARSYCSAASCDTGNLLNHLQQFHGDLFRFDTLRVKYNTGKPVCQQKQRRGWLGSFKSDIAKLHTEVFADKPQPQFWMTSFDKKLQLIYRCSRCSGLMACAQDSGLSIRVWALARTLRCVLRQDTLHSQCLPSSRCINGYQQIYCWGKPCDGLASHPGGVEILSVAIRYRNQDKLRPDGPLGSNPGFTYLTYLQVFMALGLTNQMPEHFVAV